MLTRGWRKGDGDDLAIWHRMRPRRVMRVSVKMDNRIILASTTVRWPAAWTMRLAPRQPCRASPIALCLLLVPLRFSRPIFPSLSHLKHGLSVFCIHRLRYADAVGRI